MYGKTKTYVMLITLLAKEKGLTMAKEYKTPEHRVLAANARTSYYKNQNKKLKAEIKRLTNLLDERTNPATTVSPAKDQITLTRAKIAFRRAKTGNQLIPVEQDIYVVTEGEM